MVLVNNSAAQLEEFDHMKRLLDLFIIILCVCVSSLLIVGLIVTHHVMVHCYILVVVVGNLVVYISGAPLTEEDKIYSVDYEYEPTIPCSWCSWATDSLPVALFHQHQNQDQYHNHHHHNQYKN